MTKADDNRDTATVRGPPAPGRASRARGRRSWAQRLGLWVLSSLSVAAIGGGLIVLAVIGQTLSAPDWLRERLSLRIEQNLGGMALAFGDVDLVINKGWRPRVRLRDVTLSGADGQRIVQLSDAEVSLAMRPLLRGQVQPKRIALSGAFATLRRDAAGNVSLSLGDNAGPADQAAAGVPQLIGEWEKLLTLPQLSALVSVEMDALTLRYEDARKGRAWTLDGGRIQLNRDGDDLRLAASFALLSGGDFASSVEANYTGRIGETEARFGILVRDIKARDIAAQNVALAWLEVLRAPISGALRGSVDADGALGPLSATLQIGAGVLQPTDQTRPIPFSGARSYFTYDPKEQVLVFDEVSVSSDWGTGTGEGRAYLGGVETGTLSDLIGQFTLTGLSINPEGLYREPLELDRVATDFRLELNPFRFTLGQMQITQGADLLQLSGELAAEETGWGVALDARMDSLGLKRLLALWPGAAAPKPRKWVAENLLGGTLSDIDFALRSRPGAKPDIYADFDFADADIRFLKTMPPITGATGQASLNGGRFVVTAASGQVVADQGGAVDIAGTSFIIPDIRIKKAAPGVVRMTGAGSVTAVMSLLSRPPLRVLRGTPLPVDLADGQVQLAGTLMLPLKDRVQLPEMRFHFTGEISDVSSSVLVPGQSLSAAVVRIKGDQGQVVLSGDARIGEVPVSVRWRQPLGKGVGKASRLEGSVELSRRLVETFEIGLPRGSVTGRGRGQFTLDLAPGMPPELTLKSDLRGVRLSLPQLGWAKPAPAGGMLELSGTLGEQTRIDRLVLRAAGLSATGTVLNRPGGGLHRALLSSVRLGGWLDASVELIGKGRNAPPDLRILGGTLDLRRAEFGGGGDGGERTGPLQVSLSRLQVTDTIALTDFTGRFQTTGGLAGPFRGKVNGQTEVTGQVLPQDGRSAVRIVSRDAGGVFRAAGLLRRGRGGDFSLTLLPARNPGQFDGTLRVTDTRIKDAPAIAALLNSISVVGLVDELAGQGIYFTEVDASFRLGPSRLTLYSSSAVGPSIGISMDGTYDVPNARLDMQGVISPVYMLNSIGSFLTRKGEGVIGFNYTLTGPAQSPAVLVNPLSALTPGMFREILRSGPPPRDETEHSPKRAPRRAANPADGR